jgi:hypothetical protein
MEVSELMRVFERIQFLARIESSELMSRNEIFEIVFLHCDRDSKEMDKKRKAVVTFSSLKSNETSRNFDGNLPLIWNGRND